ncbi:MAG: FAD-dependent oxidoreductase [Bacillota bacterium]|nr:FAD-dependent oxidoreductase [Bacillota bacterium]
MSKKVLVFGAGYAGVQAALTLYKKKKKNEDIEISIVDRNSFHTLLTELHEVAGDRVDDEAVIVPLRDIFRYTGVNIIKGDVTGIDFKKNILKLKSEELSYDYLVIASGSDPNYYGIPGMEEYCFPLWSYDNAIRIREHIKNCFELASQEKNQAVRKELLTFVVGGGGFTGVELIGEIAQRVKVLCDRYNIDNREVRLVLIEALPKILNNLKPKSVNKAMNYLEKRLKVEVLVNSQITRLTPNSVELKNGTAIPTRTLMWTAGVKAACMEEEPDITKGKACRIIVNEYTQTQYPNVYAIGDISAFSNDGHILPALVEGALQTGKTAAVNILADIRGTGKQKLTPKLHGVMVSVGSFFAVTDLMGMELPRPFAIITKYLVNMHYLFGIGGFEIIIKYFKHEVLFKRQKKLLIEKHYSYMTPAFWLVPIRLFLGYSWLVEGIGKINEGWLKTAMLAGSATDVNSGASVTESGEKVFRIITDVTPSWYAWIANHIVIPNGLIFQILIVITEIGLGLAFISGTFTFIAGIVSFLLTLNFSLSTGLYSYDWWYFPAALCMLGGAGRAFGIDHYLIPYLMRQWRYFVRNKRIKLWLFK